MKSTLLAKTTLFFLAALIVGCLWAALSPCHMASNRSNLPDYIEDPWPPPQSGIGAGCFIKRRLQDYPLGLGVKIKTQTTSISNLEIHQPGKKNTIPFKNRIALYMDGKQIPVDQIMEMGDHWFIYTDNEYIELPEEIFVGSNNYLAIGNHTAKVIVSTRSGNDLEYEWKFRVRIFP